MNHVFQPLVSLATGKTVAYEALARPANGTPPDQLWREARVRAADEPYQNSLVRLEIDSWFSAVREARRRGYRRIFVNTVPAAVFDARFRRFLARVLRWSRRRRLMAVPELVENQGASPNTILAAVAALRRIGFRVMSLDDADDGMPLRVITGARTAYVKLGRRYMEEQPGVWASIAAAVQSYGGVVVAEALETPEHAAAAKTLGANLGQGWLWGKT